MNTEGKSFRCARCGRFGFTTNGDGRLWCPNCFGRAFSVMPESRCRFTNNVLRKKHLMSKWRFALAMN